MKPAAEQSLPSSALTDNLLLSDASVLAAALLDEAGQIVAANAAFEATFGPPVSPCGFVDLVTVDQRPPLLAALAALRANPAASRHIDLLFARPEADASWFRAALSARAPDRPGSAGFAVQLVDIDDLKRQLIEREKHFEASQLAFTGAHIGVWDIDVLKGITTYSDVYHQMRGWAPDYQPPPGLEFLLTSIHPHDRDKVRQVYQSAMAGKLLKVQLEFRLLHSGGHWIWVDCRGSCICDADGRPVRIIGTDLDITERKQAEEELAQLSRRLKLAMEVSRIGVFEADFETGYATWDEAMLRFYGVEGGPRIKIGEVWENFLHPDDRQRVVTSLNQHIAELKPYNDQYRIVLPNGTVRYMHSRTRPFVDPDGRRLMIGAEWDETAEIMLRQDLERAKTLAEARARELEIAKAEIERIALLDPLTDLPNRRFLDQWLARFSAEPVDDRHGLAILHIDLDRFKQINDTFGHSVGDAVLKHVAVLLQRTIDDGDKVFRIGGDEFVVIRRYNDDRAALEALAERIVDTLRKPANINGYDCRFGASIGIALALGHEVDASQLLLNADIGLYYAKNRGRNRWEYFSRESRERLILTKQTSDDILRGIEHDEFLPYYQLQFEADTLNIAGIEALVRWNHPEHGILTPDKFIATAAELDILADIDGLVLNKAVADCQLFEQAGIDVRQCSVNVSSRRLRDPHLADVLQTLPRCRTPLAFELLESIFLDDYDEQVATNLELIRKAGIRIEIDDFGSGHASITSLLRLRPDTLKIDRQLTKTLPTSYERRSLVRAIIDMGHSLGVSVVGEGVETSEHAFWLNALNCDRLQGFALAVPMPPAELIGFVRRQAWRK